MKLLAINRRARFDYDILDTFEAGLMLTGPEVKSCRNGGASLAGSYVSFFGGKATVKHMKIAPYKYAASASHEVERDRVLLLKKAEAAKMASVAAEKGITIIPLEVRGARFIKMLIGIARGRKTIDKRQVIRKREVERQLRRGEAE
jgi:SsrA-binding protein